MPAAALSLRMNPISSGPTNAGAIFTPLPAGTSVDPPVATSIETSRVDPSSICDCL